MFALPQRVPTGNERCSLPRILKRGGGPIARAATVFAILGMVAWVRAPGVGTARKC